MPCLDEMRAVKRGVYFVGRRHERDGCSESIEGYQMGIGYLNRSEVNPHKVRCHQFLIAVSSGSTIWFQARDI